MSIEEYKTLQIGMYVTDSKKAKVSLVCSDFYLIKEFKKGGFVLQPLWSDGHINSEETPFWSHYSNIDLTHKLHPLRSVKPLLSDKIMKPLYCITAINKLTCERERVSAISSSKVTLCTMRHSFLLTPARKRTHIYPRIEVSQEKLF